MMPLLLMLAATATPQSAFTPTRENCRAVAIVVMRYEPSTMSSYQLQLVQGRSANLESGKITELSDKYKASRARLDKAIAMEKQLKSAELNTTEVMRLSNMSAAEFEQRFASCLAQTF